MSVFKLSVQDWALFIIGEIAAVRLPTVDLPDNHFLVA